MDAWRRMIARPGRRPRRATLPVAPRDARGAGAGADGVLTALDASRWGSPPGGSVPGGPARRTRCRPGPASRCTPSRAPTVRAGEPLLTLHTDDPERFERALEALEGAFIIAPEGTVVDRRPSSSTGSPDGRHRGRRPHHVACGRREPTTSRSACRRSAPTSSDVRTEMLSEGIIRALPKALLHDHLDGGLRPETIVELADGIGYAGLPDHGRRRAGRLVPGRRRLGLAGALPRDVRRTPSAVMQTREPPAPGRPRVRAGPRRRRGGLRRDPLRPRAAPARGAQPRRRWSRPCTPGFREGERGGRGGRARRSGSRTLLTAMRHAATSTEIAELAVHYRDEGVSASTSPGAEAGFPPTRHLDAFEYLRRENAHFTIHAGEAFGLPSIWEAIQWCGADRLGHGVRIVDDIRVGGVPYADDVAAAAVASSTTWSWAGSRRTCATGASRSRCARAATCRPARPTPWRRTRSRC